MLSKETPMKFIGLFGWKSGRQVNKYKGTGYKIGVTGAPIILDHTVAYLEAEVIDSVDVHTHTLFFGRIIDAGILNDREPMTYAFYHMVKKGKAPKTAPTYIKEEGIKEAKKMGRYVCKVCGYVTFREEPPHKCPICQAKQEMFGEIVLGTGIQVR